MREFNLSALVIGSFFVIQGACYGVSAPIWGYVCDRKPPKGVMFIGSILITLSFIFIGPLPFFPFKKTIPLIIGCLVMQGKETLELVVDVSLM